MQRKLDRAVMSIRDYIIGKGSERSAAAAGKYLPCIAPVLVVAHTRTSRLKSSLNGNTLRPQT